MDSKKILIITYALHQGGMEQSLSRLVNYLKEKQHNVEILLTEEQGEWFNLFKKMFCNVSFIPTSKAGAVVHLWKIRNFIIKSNFDILYIVCDKYSQTILPFIPSNIKIISAIRLDDPYFYNLAATNQNYVDAYAVNSLKLHDTLKPLVGNKMIEIIHNGFLTPDIKKIEGRIKFEKPFKLLFVGRLAEEKKVLILPDIVKKCVELDMDIYLNIVGDGYLMSELSSKVELYNLGKYINIVGAVPNKETQDWYLQSHVLLFPSIGEGLPNVLIESQGCGCVPISNLLPKITDTVISNNKTGYIVDNNNIDQYIDYIKRLYNDRNTWEILSTNAIIWIKENFSLEQEKSKYLNVFENTDSHKKRIRFQINIFHIFRLIYIRDWMPLYIKNIKHKIEDFIHKK